MRVGHPTFLSSTAGRALASPPDPYAPRPVQRLYVGLSVQGRDDPVPAVAVIRWLAQRLSSFTAETATGFCRGQREDTLVVTVAGEPAGRLADLARQLCLAFHQQAVGLEENGLYTRIPGPESVTRASPAGP